MNEQELIQEKAILVGCQLPHISDEHFDNSLAELASLTKTADGTVLTTVT
ncbi:GTPase HflX, partial [Bacillus atrophaeus]|nr:GTPase HflX [Bacillus atrophaeus]